MARKIAQVGPLESHLGTQPKATARNQGRPSGSLTPQPDDACQRPHSRCKNPVGIGRHQARYRCTINMYLICMLAARCRHRQNGS